MRRKGRLARPAGAGAGSAIAFASVACLLAGCGETDPYTGYHPDDAARMRRVARLESPKVTLTLRELGETYPQEEAWPMATQPFEPVYHRITEAVAFDWKYLEEIIEKRRQLMRRARKEKVEIARRVLARREKEKKKKMKAEAKAEAKAKARAAAAAGR